MKKNKSTIILILVFFVGLSVMLYPTLSDYVNQLHQSRAVATYAEDVDKLTDADYSAYFEAADAFNFGRQRIDKVRLSDAKAWLIKLQKVDGRGYAPFIRFEAFSDLHSRWRWMMT